MPLALRHTRFNYGGWRQNLIWWFVESLGRSADWPRWAASTDGLVRRGYVVIRYRDRTWFAGRRAKL